MENVKITLNVHPVMLELFDKCIDHQNSQPVEHLSGPKAGLIELHPEPSLDRDTLFEIMIQEFSAQMLGLNAYPGENEDELVIEPISNL